MTNTSTVSQAQYLSWLAHTIQKQVIVRTNVSEINYVEIHLRTCTSNGFLGIHHFGRASYFASNFFDKPTINYSFREYKGFKELKNLILSDESFARAERILLKKQSATIRRIDGSKEHNYITSDMTHPLVGHHFCFLTNLKLGLMKPLQNQTLSPPMHDLHDKYVKFLNELYK